MKNNRLVKLIKFCPFCKEKQEIYLTTRQFKNYLRYKSGKDSRCIQDIFPELNANTREQLKTGICYMCWEQL